MDQVLGTLQLQFILVIANLCTLKNNNKYGQTLASGDREY